MSPRVLPSSASRRESSDMRKALLIFGGVMLAGLLVLVLLSEFAPARPRGFTGDVGSALPEVPGWARREIPIAGSSAAIASAQGILNFSQAKQVLYTRGGVQMLLPRLSALASSTPSSVIGSKVRRTDGRSEGPRLEKIELSTPPSEVFAFFCIPPFLQNDRAPVCFLLRHGRLLQPLRSSRLLLAL